MRFSIVLCIVAALSIINLSNGTESNPRMFLVAETDPILESRNMLKPFNEINNDPVLEEVILDVTDSPSESPTETPTEVPSAAPTAVPTKSPTVTPTVSPTVVPSAGPTAVPTIVPSAIPSAAPSAVPTVAPSQSPSVVPTASPSTVAPSAQPTRQPTTSMAPTNAPWLPAQPQTVVHVDATYKFGTSVSSLTAKDKETIEETVKQTTSPVPDSVTVTVTGNGERRRLRGGMGMGMGLTLSATHNITVTVRLSYNLINFPSYTVSSLSSTVETAIKTAVDTNVFGSTLQSIAVANGASDLLDVTTYSVNTETSVTGQPQSSNGSDNGLTTGVISAIVVCSVSGLLFLLALVYWFCFHSSSSNRFSVQQHQEKRRDVYAASDDFLMIESGKAVIAL
jgi:hypothetical protein